MPRLFTAIEIPENVREELLRLRQPLPGARWQKVDELHLTLRFVGDIMPRAADEFIANIENASADVFSLRLSTLGSFGGDDPHAIWAGIDQSDALDALQRAHEKAARSAGLPPEYRSYKPHVTLARLKNSSPEAVARYLNRMSGYRSLPFAVERIVVMSSRPTVGGGPYAIEAVCPLRGSGYNFDVIYDDA